MAHSGLNFSVVFFDFIASHQAETGVIDDGISSRGGFAEAIDRRAAADPRAGQRIHHHDATDGLAGVEVDVEAKFIILELDPGNPFGTQFLLALYALNERKSDVDKLLESISVELAYHPAVRISRFLGIVETLRH